MLVGLLTLLAGQARAQHTASDTITLAVTQIRSAARHLPRQLARRADTRRRYRNTDALGPSTRPGIVARCGAQCARTKHRRHTKAAVDEVGELAEVDHRGAESRACLTMRIEEGRVHAEQARSAHAALAMVNAEA
jgi:hypothetical protein